MSRYSRISLPVICRFRDTFLDCMRELIFGSASRYFTMLIDGRPQACSWIAWHAAASSLARITSGNYIGAGNRVIRDTGHGVFTSRLFTEFRGHLWSLLTYRPGHAVRDDTIVRGRAYGRDLLNGARNSGTKYASVGVMLCHAYQYQYDETLQK